MRRRQEVDERELTVSVDGVEQTQTAERPPRHWPLGSGIALLVVAGGLSFAWRRRLAWRPA